MHKNWVITGGCGFLGTSLIAFLQKKGIKNIRIVDNLSVGTREDLAKVCRFKECSKEDLLLRDGSFTHSLVELIVGNILDESLATEVVRGADVIVHLAANTGVAPSVADPRLDCHYNVIGTFNYLEAARLAGCKCFIFASSGAIIGDCVPPLHEELPAHPVSPYGASKLAGEAYCSAYYRTYGLHTVALRFSNVYGPLSSHKKSLVASCLQRALAGEAVEVYGDGSNTRDFIYIEDLIRAVYAAVITPAAGGEIFQIATAEETTVNELVQMLMEVLARNGYKDVGVNYGQARLGDVQRNFADTSKAKRILGWEPQVPLERGLQQTLDWFVQSLNFARQERR